MIRVFNLLFPLATLVTVHMYLAAESQAAGKHSYQGRVVQESSNAPLGRVSVRVRRLYDRHLLTGRSVRESTHVTDRNGVFSFELTKAEAGKRDLVLEFQATRKRFVLVNEQGPRHLSLAGPKLVGSPPTPSRYVPLLKMTTRAMRLYGLVRKPRGSIAPGVTIAVNYLHRDKRGRLHKRWIISETNNRGEYEIYVPPSARGLLWLLHDNFVADAYPLTADFHRDFDLRKGRLVAGRVVHKARAGVWVNAFRLPSRRGQVTFVDQFVMRHGGDLRARSVLVQKDGRFALGPLTEGTFIVQVSAAGGLTAWRKHLVNAQSLNALFLDQRLQVSAQSETSKLVFRPEPAVNLTVNFVTSDGRPAKAGALTINGSVRGKYFRLMKRGDQADRNGRLVLQLPRDLSGGFLSCNATQETTYCLDTKDPAKRTRVTSLGKVRPQQQINIVAYRAPSLSVVAKSSDGKPLGQLRVIAIAVSNKRGRVVGGRQATVLSNSPGAVQFFPRPMGVYQSYPGLIPGRQIRLTIDAPGYQVHQQKLSLKEGESRQLKVTLKPQS